MISSAAVGDELPAFLPGPAPASHGERTRMCCVESGFRSRQIIHPQAAAGTGIRSPFDCSNTVRFGRPGGRAREPRASSSRWRPPIWGRKDLKESRR